MYKYTQISIRYVLNICLLVFVLFCFAMFCCACITIYQSPVLSYPYPHGCVTSTGAINHSASEVTLKYMGEIIGTKLHNNNAQ